MANVFVVEDDTAYLYVVQRVLKGLGHQVRAYSNSHDAWDAVTRKDDPIDLLLADLRFPTGQPNGVALALRARVNHPNMAVIFITAHAELLDRVGDDLGPILLKSIPPKELGAAVEDALK